MRIRELAEDPALGLTPVTGALGLDREFSSVMVTDLPDPGRYLSGAELVVTGLVWLADPRRSAAEHCELFVGAVAGARCPGLAAGTAVEDLPPPPELIDACVRHGLPLLHVPANLSFAVLTDWAFRRTSTQRMADAGGLLARHRRLVEGAHRGMAGMVGLIAQEAAMEFEVVTAAGEPVAAGRPHLAGPVRAAVARESLRTAALPERLVEHQGRAYSAFTVRGDTGTAITDWYAIFDGDWKLWPHQRLAAAREATELIGAERARIADGHRALRHTSRELVALAAVAGPPGEIEARLALIGLDPAPGLRAVAVAAAGGVRVGRLARVLLEPPTADVPVPIDVLAAESGPRYPGDPADGPDGWSSAVALIPAPVTGAGAAGIGDAAGPAAAVGERLAALAPGLGRDQVAVGVSGRVIRAADLAGAVSEARQAMRLAMRRPGPANVADHRELASYPVLLAHVPDDLLRGYRDRLLGPLRHYDTRHHSQLEITLDRFLACSASWSACASDLHIHVNTLRYRIGRINSLTGRDLSRLDHQVDFYLALRSR